MQHVNDDALQRWVPWSELSNPNAVHEFRVDVKVDDIDLNVPVDTGSTGFLISATVLNYKDEEELKKCCEPAFQYLSSSRRYYQGYWLPTTLKFTSRAGTQISSKVRILAVTEKGMCSSYENGQCTKTDTVAMPKGIMYMGVGFGRWSEEQPGSTADKNPLLNIDFEGDDTLRSGYIISDQGLILGLRKEDLTNGWKLTHLTRNTKAGAPVDRPEWKGIPMCVEVAGSECFQGTALFDTGLDYSFLGVPSAATEHLKTQLEGHWVLKNGTDVAVKVGSPNDVVVTFSFRVGDFHGRPQITPQKVRIGHLHDDGAFINTGRFFFNGYDLIFDEIAGVVGLKVKTWGDILANGVQAESQKAMHAQL